MKYDRLQLGLALILIVLGISLRLLPHPANFAPIAAIAIYGGVVLPRRLALWVPVGAMVLSDMVIGFYDIMPVTWACYALIAFVASRLLQRPKIVQGTLLTCSASLLFFVVTNFAVWLRSGMYAHSWAGLADCYAMALPFFRNTLMSDLLYTGLLFGVTGLVTRTVRSRTMAMGVAA